MTSQKLCAGPATSQPLQAADYSLEVYVNDQSGARLWVNQTQVIDQWQACGGCTNQGTINLPEAGWYPLVLEFRSNHNHVNYRKITLGWRQPTQPITVEHEIIPNEYLATEYAEPRSSTTIDSAFPGVSDLHAADLDNDGDLDVIGTAEAADDVAWWKNDGTGTFTKHLITGDFDGASAIAVADLNGDDALDIVAAARYANTIAWWPNDGSTTFTTFYTITTDFEEPFHIQTVDIDQDGNTDIVGMASNGSGDTNNPQHTAWWRNDGQSTFTYNHICNGAGQQDGYAGDIDGDGDLDMMGFSHPDSTYFYQSWWENTGDEVFATTPSSYGYQSLVDSNTLHVVNFDQDGDLDILAGHHAAAGVKSIFLYENDGLQNFTSQLIRAGATDVSEVFATDMDDDGDMDVVAAVTGLNQLLWYEKIDHVWFEHKLATAFVGVRTFAVGDFNGDGGVDVVAGGGNTINLIQTQRYIPPEVSFSSATYTDQEGDDNVVDITVQLSAVVNRDITVDVTTSNDTAQSDSDYAQQNTTITIPAGQQSQTITVTIVDDDLVEDDETVILTLSNPTNATLGEPHEATLTIQDNDVLPVNFSSATYDVHEGVGNATISVELDRVAASDVTVQYSTSISGTATPNNDYAPISDTLTIPQGQLSADFTVPIVDDDILEDDETIILTLSNPTYATLGDIREATVTIQDDENIPGVQPLSGVTIRGPQAGNAGSQITFVAVTQPATATLPISYTWQASGQPQQQHPDGGHSDYVRFTWGITGTQHITVSAVNAGQTLWTASHTIELHGRLARVRMSKAMTTTMAAAGEMARAAVMYITLDEPSFAPVTVEYATNSGSAVAGQDFVAQTGGVTFAPGETQKAITTTIADDITIEGQEQFSIVLGRVSGPGVIETESSVITIDDNDSPPEGTVHVEHTTYTIAESGEQAEVTIARSGGTSGEVLVDYAVYDDSAQAKSDYTPQRGTITFADGETHKTVTVPIVQDTAVEGDETAMLTLGNVRGGAAIGTQKRTVLVIVEDDLEAASSGIFQLSEPTLSVNEATDVVTVTVMRTGGLYGDVAMRYDTVGGTAQAGSDYARSSGIITFTTAEEYKHIPIDIHDDVFVEGDETISFLLHSISGGGTLGTRNHATVTIVDDDTEDEESSTIQFTSDTYAGFEDSREAEITIERTGSISSAVMIRYDMLDISAEAGIDYVRESGVLLFAVGEQSKQFTVIINDDSEIEGNENVQIVLRDAAGDAVLGARNTARLLVVDNDTPPQGALQFVDVQQDVYEDNPTVTVAVERTGGSEGTVSVPFATHDATALAPSDYAPITGTLTFADGQTTATFSITLVNDTDIEGNETLRVALDKENVTGGASVGTQGVQNITIVDDDVTGPGTLQLLSTTKDVHEDAQQAKVAVVRTGNSLGAVSVAYKTSDGTALAGSDYTATSGEVSFADGEVIKTIAIPISNDEQVEASEAFTLTLHTPTGGATLGTQASAMLIILDNDSPEDVYETDSVCAGARIMRTDGTMEQTHTFHDDDDEDWITFFGLENETYRIEALTGDDSDADIWVIVYAECDGTIEAEQQNTLSNDVRMDFIAPRTGLYFAQVKNENKNENTNDSRQRTRQAEVAEPYRLKITHIEPMPDPGVLIIAAGRLDGDEGERTQANIHHVSNRVYDVYRQQGFLPESIAYLATDTSIHTATMSLATLDNLKTSITTWAAQRMVGPEKPLVLYLVDHGEHDQFFLDGTGVVLEPQDLHAWLTELEEARPGTPIIIVIEACYSGSFIDAGQIVRQQIRLAELHQSVSKVGRTVITSTSADQVAFVSEKGTLFLDFFLDGVQMGYNTQTSFRTAQDNVLSRHMNNQTPSIDANGNGVPNEVDDFVLISRFPTPPNADKQPPVIRHVAVTNVLTVTQAGELQVGVADEKGIAQVWAEVEDANAAPPESSKTYAFTTLFTKTLVFQESDEKQDWYTSELMFDETGTYSVTVYVLDSDGLQTQAERTQVMRVQVNPNDATTEPEPEPEPEPEERRVYLPLVRR